MQRSADTTNAPYLTARRLGMVLGAYAFMALAYYFTIVYNGQGYVKEGQSIWSIESFPRIIIDFALKLFITAPIWYLIFRQLPAKPIWKRVAAHVVALPVFIFGWKYLYYAICDAVGYGHLRGYGEVWDIYIPFLQYVLQFALFHVFDYNYQLQLKQKEAAELKQLSHQAEMLTLKAQLQPHFLFNTLNSISASLPQQNEETRELIARLADTLRFAMNTAQQESILFEDELHFVKSYLSLEQQRFSDRLKVCYEIDEAVKTKRVPPFILQPLVENALKHGIAKSVAGGIVTIAAKLQNNKISFTVSDTGAGINGYQPQQLFNKGIGLKNTQLRLQKLFGEDIHIAHLQPSGTSVQFAIPSEV